MRLRGADPSDEDDIGALANASRDWPHGSSTASTSEWCLGRQCGTVRTRKGNRFDGERPWAAPRVMCAPGKTAEGTRTLELAEGGLP